MNIDMFRDTHSRAPHPSYFYESVDKYNIEKRKKKDNPGKNITHHSDHTTLNTSLFGDVAYSRVTMTDADGDNPRK